MSTGTYQHSWKYKNAAVELILSMKNPRTGDNCQQQEGPSSNSVETRTCLGGFVDASKLLCDALKSQIEHENRKIEANK